MSKIILTLVVLFSSYLNAAEINLENFKKKNPGNLTMYSYIPSNLKTARPMIVLLHGCTQTAKDFVINSGWTKFADQFGFSLLIPSQKKENNSFMCFNWFEKGDQQRGSGEAASIAGMIEQMKEDYIVDEKNIFISGFSAGGGMTAILMATYPELFRSAAISSGIAYGCAESATAGLMCMYGFTDNTSNEWLKKVKLARPGYQGTYPTVSIWQGTSDGTVKPMNANELAEQWSAIHGIDPESAQTEQFGDYDRVTYSKDNNVFVEKIMLNGLGHKISVSPGTELKNCGVVGTWEEDTNLCASYHILRFWKLIN